MALHTKKFKHKLFYVKYFNMKISQSMVSFHLHNPWGQCFSFINHKIELVWHKTTCTSKPKDRSLNESNQDIFTENWPWNHVCAYFSSTCT